MRDIEIFVGSTMKYCMRILQLHRPVARSRPKYSFKPLTHLESGNGLSDTHDQHFHIHFHLFLR